MKMSFRTLQIVFSLAAFILVFLIPGLPGQLIILSVFLLLCLFNSNRKAIFSLFFKLSALLIFTLLVHLFFRFGETDYWSAFTSAALWIKASYFTLRNANILLVMSYLIKSGQRIDIALMTNYLEGKRPYRYIQPLTLAMRYVYLIRDEFRSLQQVHRIMGIKKPPHYIALVKYYTSLIVPTIISSLERAEHLSLAMTSRGYNQE